MTQQKRKIFTLLGSIITVLVLYFGYQHLFYVTTDNAQIQGHAVMLAPKVTGFIQKVNVQEGEFVKQGQILAEIAPQEFENILVQAQSDLLSISAKMKEAEKNYFRMQELYSKSVVSQQQFDQGKSTYNSIKAQYDSAQTRVNLAELNLGNTKISAPSDGFVAKKSAEAGQLANMGVPLFGFVDATERWVIANFKETEIASVIIGSKVYIDVDAIKGESFEGKVVSIFSATGSTFSLLPPDNATGNFTKVVQRIPVKISLENLTPEKIRELRVGLSAWVKVKK